MNLLGYKYDELMGQNIHEYIHYKDVNNRIILPKNSPMYNAMKNGETYKGNNEHLIKKDGSFLSVSIVATPVFEDKKIVGSIVVFKDRSEKKKIKLLESEKLKNQKQMIYSMIEMIEARDSYTAGHTKRVADYCELIARQMNYSEKDIKLIKNAAWLHDIGKISTPDNVLLNPNKLDDTEYKLIQDHLNSGYEMLKKIDQYKVIADIMREHHERYDGKGYPRGLKADEINPLSRIMIVADAFDAMTTSRVYKPRKTLHVALLELEEMSEKQFHPEVVIAALEALKDVEIDDDISQAPKTSLEEHRFSYFYRDRLTNLFIVEYLPLALRYNINDSHAYMYNIRLHNFTSFNKKFGWQEGDKFLVDFANYLKKTYNDCAVFRVEGDDFMILCKKKKNSVYEDIDRFLPLKESILSFSVEIEHLKDINKK